MLSTSILAAMAYLDSAQPKAEPWHPDEADLWLHGKDREAVGLRAVLVHLGYEPDEAPKD